MIKPLLHRVLRYLIGLVWLVNGLFCKVLNYVPRHQEIVGEIVGFDHMYTLTKAIGVAEILMAIWIFSGLNSRLNSILQIVTIATMNILEFTLVPELLLWGRFNILFATLMILVIYYNEYILNRKLPL